MALAASPSDLTSISVVPFLNVRLWPAPSSGRLAFGDMLFCTNGSDRYNRDAAFENECSTVGPEEPSLAALQPESSGLSNPSVADPIFDFMLAPFSSGTAEVPPGSNTYFPPATPKPPQSKNHKPHNHCNHQNGNAFITAKSIVTLCGKLNCLF